MTGTRGVIAAVAVVVLGVGACSGDDPEPHVAPPSSSPPSTTAASGPIAPAMPPEARGTDAAAAEAFVKFYWEMVNYAQATGDVDGLKDLAFKCINCDNGAAFIEDTYDAEGQIRGGNGRPSKFITRFVKRTGNWWAIVECTVSLTKQVVDLPGSEDDKRYGGGSTDVRFYLQPRSGSWTIRSLAKQ